MNDKHRQTLEFIFTDPIPANINWQDIESLLIIGLKATAIDGKPSRIRVLLNDSVAIFHRPNHKKVIEKSAIKSVKKFLIDAGIKS